MTGREPRGARIGDAELVELAKELRGVWHALTCEVEHGAHLEGSTRQQFWVLGALAHGATRMSDLAAQTQTSQASLTGIVDRLVERGMVERVRSENDRRVVEVALTEAGRAEMRARHARMLDRLRTVLEPLDAEERRTFLALVRKLAKGRGGHC